jgi:hypothetical protein
MGTHQAGVINLSLHTRELALDELEDAYEHAEILLTRHLGMLSGQLSALLSAWYGDLSVIIEERYDPGPVGDADHESDAV